MHWHIQHKDITYILQLLSVNDANTLGVFFDALSEQTKQRFAPHPINAQQAVMLCNQKNDTAERFIATDQHNNIQAYFILEHNIPYYEKDRLALQGINFNAHKSVSFAPVVADNVQNTGIASSIKPILINYLKSKTVTLIMLMGGTQETNERAIAFYQKFGFVKKGGYATTVWNHDMVLFL